MTISSDIDLSVLIADTEAEIMRVVEDRDASTVGVYEMIRYHLGLDGDDGPRGKRMRPLLGLLAYMSITGDHRAALPGAAAVELGHNFSLVHDDIEDGDVERRHRPTLWTLHGVPQAINTGDLIFSLSRVALHRLTDLGFSDTKVLRLMRLYDETCVELCEGQYLDIATSASDEPMSVELYFDMIGRKTAALISASIEAGALLATDDDEVIARYRRFGWSLGLAFQVNDDLLGIWGQRAGDRQGAHGPRPPQEDAAGAVRDAARVARGPAPAVRPLPDPRPGRGGCRRDHRHPRPHRRPRVHPRRGSPASGCRPRRARRHAASRPGRSRPAGRDHHLGDHRLGGRPRSRPERRHQSPTRGVSSSWTLVAWLVVVAAFLVTRFAFLDRDLPPWNLAMYQPIDESAYTIPAFNLHHYGTWTHQDVPWVPLEGSPMNVLQSLVTSWTLGLDWTYWGFRASSVPVRARRRSLRSSRSSGTW